MNVGCHWKGQVVGTVRRRLLAIHSSGQTISSLAHIEGITMGAGEGLAAGVYGAGFTARSLAEKGAMGGMMVVE